MRKVKNKEIQIWADNRGLTSLDKFVAWRSNVWGGAVRLFEKLYFGYPLFVILQENGIEHISHLKSVERHLSSSHLNDLRKLPNNRGYSEPKVLNAVVIDLNTGAIKLDSGHVLVQGIGIRPFLSGNGYSQLRKLIKFQGEAVRGKYVLLPKQKYYYHFLVEELPKLLRALSQDSSIQVLTSSLQPEYVKQLLSSLEDRVMFRDQEFLRIQALVNFQETGFDLERNINVVRKLISDSKSPIQFSGKIFVLRGSKARSDHELEELISNLLEPYGFQSIDASSLSVFEQAQLFESATHLIGLHGGGLSNLVFTGRNTNVLEIFNSLYRNTCFQDICKVLNLNYSSVDLLKNEKIDVISQWAASN